METFAPSEFPILPAGDSPSLSFSELLNQTSSNFEYNVNSSTELVSPNTTSSSSSSSSQSSPLSEPTQKYAPYNYMYQDQQQPVYDYNSGYAMNYNQQMYPYAGDASNNFSPYAQSAAAQLRPYYQHQSLHHETSMPLPANVQTPGSKLSRKSPKKKKKRDPNEPSRPVSAYALFFRETQSIIKSQKTDATFGEISKIVASMWDGLGESEKTVYKQKTENAKREYLRELAAYRASLVSTGPQSQQQQQLQQQQQQQQTSRTKPY